MNQYAKNLKPKGLLLLSGFYEKDVPDLLQSAHPFGLTKTRTDLREGWASLLLQASS
jgi:ribosomal protein L11 methyltransferase